MLQQPPKNPIYYFTQLHLIHDILTSVLTQSLPHHFNIPYSQINPSGDISIIVILSQQPNNPQPSTPTIKTSTKITIIQMQKIIKFHMIHKQTIQNINHQIYDQQNLQQFWINYTNYLPNKLYQSYLLTDLHTSKINQLTQIFNQRIIQKILKNIQNTNQLLSISSSPPKDPHQKIPINFQQNIKDLYILCISSNFLLLNKFLSPKQYNNLEASLHQLYQILHRPQIYKITFEKKWGKTGFTLSQKNWIKMYRNKTIETNKKRNK